MKIRVYQHSYTNLNYKGEGPNWYNGSDVSYSLRKNTKDYLKESNYSVSTKMKDVTISKQVLWQAIHDAEGYEHKLAEKLFKMSNEFSERCRELFSLIYSLQT